MDTLYISKSIIVNWSSSLIAIFSYVSSHLYCCWIMEYHYYRYLYSIVALLSQRNINGCNVVDTDYTGQFFRNLKDFSTMARKSHIW